jgi:hypothetical protein
MEYPCEYPREYPCEYRVSTMQVTAASSAFKGGDRFAHYSIARRRAEASPGPGGHDPKVLGVLTGYSRGTHGVLTGYSRGTPDSTPESTPVGAGCSTVALRATVLITAGGFLSRRVL